MLDCVSLCLIFSQKILQVHYWHATLFDWKLLLEATAAPKGWCLRGAGLSIPPPVALPSPETHRLDDRSISLQPCWRVPKARTGHSRETRPQYLILFLYLPREELNGLATRGVLTSYWQILWPLFSRPFQGNFRSVMHVPRTSSLSSGGTPSLCLLHAYYVWHFSGSPRMSHLTATAPITAITATNLLSAASLTWQPAGPIASSGSVGS